MLNEVKLAAISVTSNIKKARCGYANTLKNRIKSVKNSQDYSIATINSLEDELQTFVNIESKVLHRKKNVQNQFLAQTDPSIIASTLKKKCSTPLSVLKKFINNEKVPFSNETERNDYILNFYKNIYSVKSVRHKSPSSSKHF